MEMMRTIDDLRRQNVHFRSVTEQFDSDTAHGRFALQTRCTISSLRMVQ
ncbi:hypothetical protein Mnod_8756 (plasmid) [Methylobacterium nodulans ORS 2060]|uniref:Uncharacterized protein n=1 Tax=Methylobacterium nodulans (strain LMG 21967 / CNCM I-2342 / ORS 2060) TaxID=460265 RepID=B8IWL9_METNO|nr:hypothetical protein Mnod_8756 [Methylobacterium nodulans ORS 2060]